MFSSVGSILFRQVTSELSKPLTSLGVLDGTAAKVSPLVNSGLRENGYLFCSDAECAINTVALKAISLCSLLFSHLSIPIFVLMNLMALALSC